MEIDKNKFAEFQKIYIQKNAHIIEHAEKKRLELVKERRNLKIALISAIFVLLILFGELTYFYNESAITDGYILGNIETWLFITFVLSGILFNFYKHKIPSYEHKYKVFLKETIFPHILKYYGIDKWKYHNYEIKKNKYTFGTEFCESTEIKEEYIIEPKELQDSGLFREQHTINIDDEFEGSYKKVNFKISEINTYSTAKSSRKILNSNCGIVFLFQQPKIKEKPTIVASKGILSQKNEHLYHLFIILFSVLLLCVYLYIIIFVSNGLENIIVLIGATILILFEAIINFKKTQKKDKFLNKVTLEYPQFNKHFNIYSYNQTEARYLLNPSFMERFYNLKDIFKTKKISCSFYDGKLMVVVYTKKDVFEPGNLYQSLINPKNIAQFYKELNAIYNIIDVLKIKN